MPSEQLYCGPGGAFVEALQAKKKKKEAWAGAFHLLAAGRAAFSFQVLRCSPAIYLGFFGIESPTPTVLHKVTLHKSAA